MSAEVVGRKVGSVGYGLLGLTPRSAMQPEEQSFAAMRAALSANCNLWDAGEFYGPSPDVNSLTLLNKYYAKYPEDADKVVLNVKGALQPNFVPNGSPEFVRQSVERCVEMLGGKGKIDMFECARRDPNVPLEATLATLGELVKEGKIGGVALSEVNANTIRAAAKITKIVAVEVEISLFSTEPLSNGIAQTCAELNIPIIAYSPIGRGMLSGQIKSFDDIPEKDHRRMLPRFQPPNFENNMKLVKQLEVMAQKKKCTSAQLALAWVVNLSENKGMPTIIPIPGARTVDHAIENGKASEVELTEEEMAEIDHVLATCEVAGDRYHPAGMKSLNG
ncbi:hypothetical protein HO133_000218 [Letharia lupina]|uniref:NADP-dependent oxidoreductase domain-containing protein n=1 Tax=Letharia lupina TaxID=560253 RepID=A0A8H6CHJ3_9LECA|nr:uncharacterized protein HO133_000218 [Letharia lupina]KAF6223376.1 hypothetical protein HO133_000218 [Letharia lupina]